MEDQVLNDRESMLSKDLHVGMKPEHIEKLKEQHRKVHSSCLQKIDQWEKFKKDYEVLKSRLESLPDRISYDIMVPFGSLAFMPGQLIHTNEIMTLLGSNWFAEVSAKHAAEISKRRIEQCEKMLEDLVKEKEQYENWLHYISEEFMCTKLVDISEPYIEEREKQFIERRKKNIQACNQSKDKTDTSLPEEERKDVQKNMAETSDNDYFEILLENLGKQESLRGEMNEDMPSDLDDNDDYDGHEDEDLDDSSEGDGNEEKYEEEYGSDEHLKNNGKHVKWKDQEGEKMKNCITFTHSSRKCKSHSNTKPMAISKTKSKAKESVPLSPVKIQSPSDIYKCFSTKPEQHELKSILKRTTSMDDTDVLTECSPKNDVEEVSIVKARFKEQTAFTGEIVEHETEKGNLSEKPESTASRPTSRFKAQRQSKQK